MQVNEPGILYWTGDVTIGAVIDKWKDESSGREGPLIAFAGTYRHGPSGNRDALFMTMCVAAALTWNSGDGMVIDLSDVYYVGGDRLFYWESILGRFGLSRSHYPISIVWSDTNKPHVQSLLREGGDDDLLDAAFNSVEQAVAYLSSTF